MHPIFKNKVFLISAAIIVWIVGFFVGSAFKNSMENNKIDYTKAGVIFLPEKRELPQDITLTDHNNQKFNMQNFKGKWSLLFFGYTFCPDICPTTLVDLRNLREKMPQSTLDKMQIFMITVDPYRDNPEQLKGYLEYFQSDFMGLTGDMTKIETLAKRVSIPFITPDPSKDFYTVDHSGNLAILDPSGRQIGFIRAPFNIEQLAEVLPHLFK